MSANDQMRDMIAQLMGTQSSEATRNIPFDDSSVCKSFLLSCCPNEILTGTRMDMGECKRLHDVALRADYEIAAKKKDYSHYLYDTWIHLKYFVSECDKRTEEAKVKLKETQEELTDEAVQKANVLHKIGERIGMKLAEAEEAGAKGDVNTSLALMADVEELKKEKSSIESDYRSTMPASSYQQQKLRVCEICCAYLGIHDNDRRLADHFGGKLHLGFVEIREKLLQINGRVLEKRGLLTQEERDRELQRDEDRLVRRKLYSDGRSIEKIDSRSQRPDRIIMGINDEATINDRRESQRENEHERGDKIREKERTERRERHTDHGEKHRDRNERSHRSDRHRSSHRRSRSRDRNRRSDRDNRSHRR